MADYPLVLVRWLDACSEDGWTDAEHISPPIEVESVGRLVRDEPGHISVAGSTNQHGVACTMTVPRGMVLSIHLLHEGKRMARKRRKGGGRPPRKY